MAYTAVLCMRAADRLFQGRRARAVFSMATPCAGCTPTSTRSAPHHINSWDISGPIYGQVAFGLEPTNPLV